jgi:hypothetical protein
MSIFDELVRQQAEEDLIRDRNESKLGEYDNPENGCPNCGRHRVMIGDDKKHRCEKCYWCIEDNEYDSEFAEYMK